MSTLSIAVSPGEAWGALEEDGAIVELRIARLGGGAPPGALMLGRIVALQPELPAALVDIGEARAAFLSADDAQPRKGLAGLTEGEAVLVQVKKEARADKATGVTLRPLLEGVYVDLRPGRAGISVRGRRLDEAERQRLSAALARLAQPGEGIDIADRAQGAGDEALAADVAALRARWQAIAAARARATPPARLEPEEGPAVEIIAAFLASPPARIVIDDRAAFAEARQWLQRHRPALAAALEYRAPAFDDDIAAQVEAALAPRVMLPGGGALTIETTAAATMIDVDSGGAPALAVNLAAARAAARQIRLRNLAGPVVIDFIALRRPQEREPVRAALAAALARDPAAPQLLGWTRLGHMELVRPRRHAALDEVLFERGADGGRIKTALTVALEALRAAARAADAAPGAAQRLSLAPEVATCLREGAARAARLALEARLGRALQLHAEPGRPRAAFDIAPA
jgi:Rne/Rng family ribonuclease